MIGERLLTMDVEVAHDEMNGARLGGVAQVKCRPALGSTRAKMFAVPHRRYSLSRLAMWPGCAGRGGRTSAWSETGFSSRQTTGSSLVYGCSSRANTSSILAMYSASSSATHHLGFPPRLEVVGLQEHANRLSPHLGQAIATMRCFSGGASTSTAPGCGRSYTALAMPPVGNDERSGEWPAGVNGTNCATAGALAPR